MTFFFDPFATPGKCPSRSRLVMIDILAFAGVMAFGILVVGYLFNLVL